MRYIIAAAFAAFFSLAANPASAWQQGPGIDDQVLIDSGMRPHMNHMRGGRFYREHANVRQGGFTLLRTTTVRNAGYCPRPVRRKTYVRHAPAPVSKCCAVAVAPPPCNSCKTGAYPSGLPYTGPATIVTGTGAYPSGQPYVGPVIAAVKTASSYTDKSCHRNEDAPGVFSGREGYGPNGQLGCWRH